MNDRRTHDLRMRMHSSRWLLPLELFMAPVLFAAALTTGGFLGNGRLYEAAAYYGSPFWCFFFLAVAAVAKFLVAGFELALGRRWSVGRVYASVSARCVLAFVAFSLWAYIIYLLISTPSHGAASPFLIIAPWFMVGNMWAYYQSYRVRCLLDPRMSTSALEGRMVAERNEALH